MYDVISPDVHSYRFSTIRNITYTEKKRNITYTEFIRTSYFKMSVQKSKLIIHVLQYNNQKRMSNSSALTSVTSSISLN